MRGMSKLQLRFLGTFHLQWGEQNIVAFRTEKVRALLVYLAVEADRPHRRESLAALLWPEMAQKDALSNLRKGLYRLKQTLTTAVSSPAQLDQLLTITRQEVIWHTPAVTLDLHQFQQLSQPLPILPHADLTPYEQAAALCLGELLPGFNLPDTPDFEAWLNNQRTQFHTAWGNLLHHLSHTHAERGNLPTALTYARQQLKIEPWDESTHRQLMRLYAANGQRAAALAQYETCRSLLMEELGLTPEPATKALYQQLQQQAEKTSPAAAPAAPDIQLPYQLPPTSTPLVGRQSQREQLINHLLNPDCRLVTLIGTGGMGKTRLAIAVGEQLREAHPAVFADGLFFIELAGLSQAELLPTAVAEALHISLNSHQPIPAQLIEFIGQRQLLLLLDNFDELLSGATWLNQLLTACPRLKLLITSREPLNLYAEWRYPLAGLPYPNPAELSTLSLPEAAQFPAVQLFVQVAQRVKPDFAYTAENGAAISHICQLVEGSPLALEMAAGWVRLMACDHIALQISQSLDFLTAHYAHLPPRQRSMRAIFEQTWRTLAPREQAVLPRLALFRGGFTLEAALATAEATPDLLLTLIDKSLLRYDATHNRYTVHELLRQFAAAHAPVRLEETATFACYSEYYLRLVTQQGARLQTTQAQDALAIIKADVDNVRQAWLWAARHQQRELLSHSVASLAEFYRCAGLAEEAITFLRRAIAALQGTAETNPVHLIAQILHYIVENLTRSDQYQEALTTVRAAQKLAEISDDHALVNQLQMDEARIYWEQGRYEKAHAILDAAIRQSEATTDLSGVARGWHTKGNAYWSTSDYDAALAAYERGRQVAEQVGNSRLVSTLTGNMGAVYWRQKRYMEALHHYEIALVANQASGQVLEEAIWLGNIGLVYLDLHEDERAEQYITRALRTHRLAGRLYYQVDLLLGETELFWRRGDVHTAVARQQEAATIAYRLRNQAYMLDCEQAQARLALRQGDTAVGRQLLQSLLMREFRPDMLTEIEQLLVRLPETAYQLVEE